MSDPFIGEIQIFAGKFAPRGWALCNGQLMSVQQNTALFSILSTMYGGDGRTTFALPNLMGRAPMGVGSGAGLTPRSQGAQVGSSAVTLLTTQMPAHTHPVGATTIEGDLSAPNGNIWAQMDGKPAPKAYSNSAPNVTMNPMAIGVAGGSQPHNNMQPYLALNFIIALDGVYPSRP